MNNYFQTTSNTNNWSTQEPLTLEKIMAAIKLIPPCPFKEYMVKKGYSPDNGWKMILPESSRYCVGGYYTNFPDYVQFSVLCGNYICFVHASITSKVMEYENSFVW